MSAFTKKVRLTEFLLLFFIFVGELGLAAVVYLASAITAKHAFLVFFSVYFLQFLTSTIQGGISDHSLRRISLIIAFSAVSLAQIFFLLAFRHDFMLIGAVVLYGFLGNITPIARAALVDTELKRDFRLSVGLSTIAIAVGWVTMMMTAFYFSSSPIVACILVTVLCFSCNFLVFRIDDKEDKNKVKIYPYKTFKLKYIWNFAKKIPHIIKHEFSLIASLCKHPEVRWGLGGYLAAETAFYLIFARGKGQLNNPEVFFIVFTWVIGYIFGASSQTWIFPKNKEKSGLWWGASISISAMLFLIALTLLGVENRWILGFVNALFAFGFGFFVPCLFALVSKKYPVHLQGKVYGLVDAVDSLGLIIAVTINHIPHGFSIVNLMVFSLILTLLALFCFFMTARTSGKKRRS